MVRADALAGEYPIMVDKAVRPKTWLMPSTKCCLSIQGTDHHGHYQNAIRRAVAIPTLHRYLEKRHHWNTETTHTIDWDSFQTAARTYPGSRNHLLKLVYDKLPTNLYRSRYDKSKSARCHFCNEFETFEHLCLSQCNPRSNEFRINMMTNINSYFSKTNAPDSFSNTFNNAITVWFQSRSLISTPLATHMTNPPELWRRQAAIGWSQMTRGFLAKQWKTLYSQSQVNERLDCWLESEADNDVIHPNEDDEVSTISMDSGYNSARPQGLHPWSGNKDFLTPTRFMSGLIRTIWDTMTDLWQNHIQHIHDCASQIAQHAETKSIQDQIRALHAMQNQTMAAHRDKYFHPDLDQYLIQTPLAQMKCYLQRYQPVILHSIKQATTLATNAPKITNFPGFAYTAHPPRDLIHHVREEPIHWKHTKIWNRPITEYFKPTNQTIPSNSSNSFPAPD